MMSKVNFVYLVLISLAVAQCTAENISDPKWFYCFGDFCNTDGTEQFCSTKFQKCRRCSEVVDDCFTSEMPLNCTKTCLNNYEKKILKAAMEKPCGIIQEIDNGNHNGSQSDLLEPGTVIQYSCQNGHRLVGFDILQCMAYGQWSSPPPRCEEILCPALSPIRNGNHNGSLKCYVPAITVITSCEDGFQLIGENTTTCTSDGQWSNNLPTCEQMLCANPPPIRNGKWVPLHEHTVQFTYGHILNPKCDTGFSIDTPTLWTCYEGLWKSNVTFVPSCFKQGESTTCNINLWFFLFILSSVLFLISLVLNIVPYLRKLQTFRKKWKKLDKKDVEYGRQDSVPQEVAGETAEVTQALLNKPDDSSEVVSLNGKRKNDARKVNGYQNCPPESHTANRSELPQPSNMTEPGEKFVLKVITNNYIDNTNNNHATVTHTGDGGDHTTPKSTREEDRVNDTSPHEPNVPHHENDKSPIEETGVSIQPENPDSQDVNVSQQPERVPDSMQIQPVEADDVVPARPEGVPSVMEPMESSHGIKQLNVDQPGGTVPMKSMSTDSGAYVGTQPLKHDDDFTGNNDYTRVRNSRDADRSISQDESLNNIEIDEDDDAMSSQRVDGDHTDENVH